MWTLISFCKYCDFLQIFDQIFILFLIYWFTTNDFLFSQNDKMRKVIHNDVRCTVLYLCSHVSSLVGSKLSTCWVIVFRTILFGTGVPFFGSGKGSPRKSCGTNPFTVKTRVTNVKNTNNLTIFTTSPRLCNLNKLTHSCLLVDWCFNALLVFICLQDVDVLISYNLTDLEISVAIIWIELIWFINASYTQVFEFCGSLVLHFIFKILSYDLPFNAIKNYQSLLYLVYIRKSHWRRANQ